MKTKNNGGASVRELKAAALDVVVKAELATKRAAVASKMSELKARRLARDAEEHDSIPHVEPAAAKSWPRRAQRSRSAS